MLIFVSTVVAGFITGSFLTSFVGRLHEGRDFVFARSACGSCNQSLGVLDLVPLFSWLALRGRCRHCDHRVSLYYPAVELVSAAAFTLFYLFWPYTFIGWELVLFIGYLLALVVLLALAIYDLRWWLLPNKLTYPLVIWGLVLLGIRLLIDFDLGLLSAALFSMLAGGGLFYVIFQLADKYIGGGDVKLGFVLGLLLLDWRLSLLMIFLSSLIGTAVSLPLMAGKRKGKALKAKLPFGPFLIVAFLLAIWFGQSLIEWYLGFVRV